MAKLATWLGSHVTRACRESPAFHRRMQLLRKLIEGKDRGTDLDDEELAEGVAAGLAVTSVQPMLMNLCDVPGGPGAKADMRSCIQSQSLLHQK